MLILLLAAAGVQDGADGLKAHFTATAQYSSSPPAGVLPANFR